MGQVCQRRAPEDRSPDVTTDQERLLKHSAPSSSKAKSTQEKSTSASQKVDGKTDDEWKSAGNDAVKTADYSAGYLAYSKGLKANPTNAMILSNRSLCLEKLGRLEEAVDDAKRCTVLRPDFVKAFLRAATILRQLKRPYEAVDVLRKAPASAEVNELLAKLKPEAAKSAKSHFSTLDEAERLKEEGNELFKKGLFEKALDTYGKALKACNDQKGDLAVAIRNNRAGCYQQLSDFHAVVNETNFVLEQQPDNLKAIMRRMLALEPLEKYEEALADARRVIQQVPGHEAANKMQHRLSKVVRDRKRDASVAGA